MREQLKFFDVDNQPIVMTFKSKYQKWKYDNHYSKADYMSDIRCKNCIHRFINSMGTKTYYKCELLGISSSSATDIRLSNVCDLFEMRVKQ